MLVTENRPITSPAPVFGNVVVGVVVGGVVGVVVVVVVLVGGIGVAGATEAKHAGAFTGVVVEVGDDTRKYRTALAVKFPDWA